jgi:translation initiation factor IF-3
MLGVLDTHEALRKAREAGLDLVEVNPKAFPPVCKIMDFGKFKYEEKKRAAAARKNQVVQEMKEIKLRPKTDVGDMDTKIRHARTFLEEGHRVKVTCRFRGREITHPEEAAKQLREFVERTKDLADVELAMRMEGKAMVLGLVPNKGQKPVAKSA